MISVIIPTYNEEQALPATLSHLLAQQGRYEVIAVDGGSTDKTRDLLCRESRIRLLVAPKGRASQMNAGAKGATGEWLLFLHADTFLPEGALVRLNALQNEHAIQAGGFFHQFSGDDWRLRLISWMDNYRCRRSRIIYGDQAMFVRRELFEQLGGFPDRPYLEDVGFCERLVGITTPVLLSPPVVTDSRKFVKMGVWMSLIRVLCIILHVEYQFPFLPRAFFRDVR